MRRDRSSARNNAVQNRPNTLRIIGGEWRSRRIRFPGLTGLRPTPDRVWETLFNWLAPDLAGSRCLDLFAGSGALGLEALSRGAASVTLQGNLGGTAGGVTTVVGSQPAGGVTEMAAL